MATRNLINWIDARFRRLRSLPVLRPGLIAETFRGLELKRICFVHIDLDIYKSIFDALDFAWPRLADGGGIVFYDYGFASCPGARNSVDKYSAGTTTQPWPLASGQAVVFKHAELCA
jgi:O-methyltransferase